jgi:hypothetical protein
MFQLQRPCPHAVLELPVQPLGLLHGLAHPKFGFDALGDVHNHGHGGDDLSPLVADRAAELRMVLRLPSKHSMSMTSFNEISPLVKALAKAHSCASMCLSVPLHHPLYSRSIFCGRWRAPHQIFSAAGLVLAIPPFSSAMKTPTGRDVQNSLQELPLTEEFRCPFLGLYPGLPQFPDHGAEGGGKLPNLPGPLGIFRESVLFRGPRGSFPEPSHRDGDRLGHGRGENKRKHHGYQKHPGLTDQLADDHGDDLVPGPAGPGHPPDGIDWREGISPRNTADGLVFDPGNLPSLDRLHAGGIGPGQVALFPAQRVIRVAEGQPAVPVDQDEGPLSRPVKSQHRAQEIGIDYGHDDPLQLPCVITEPSADGEVRDACTPHPVQVRDMHRGPGPKLQKKSLPAQIDPNVPARVEWGHEGHDKHAGHSVEMFRNLFWVCLALTIPALIWEPMLQEWFGYRRRSSRAPNGSPPCSGRRSFSTGAGSFCKGAVRELGDRMPGMMTLISLAIGVAFLYSVAVLLGFDGHALWWELSTLVTIMLLGHWIEMRSIFQAQGALKELAKLLPDTALRLVDEDRTEEVPVERLNDGDLVLIRPGASIPVDGVVKRARARSTRR